MMRLTLLYQITINQLISLILCIELEIYFLFCIFNVLYGLLKAYYYPGAKI